MYQQINLFQPVFRREAKVFSARTLAQVVALASVLAIAGVALLELQLTRHATTRALLDSQYRALENQLRALEERDGAGRHAALDTRIAELEARLADGAEELTEMRGLMLRRGEGFASVLEALARHPLHGLWLTRIRAQEGVLEIEGIAQAQELIPSYLELLGADAVLASWGLSAVQLERADMDAGALQFRLRSGAAPPPGGVRR